MFFSFGSGFLSLFGPWVAVVGAMQTPYVVPFHGAVPRSFCRALISIRVFFFCS